MTGYYNGYSPKERDRTMPLLRKWVAQGVIKPAAPPCEICDDPEAATEFHSEDYSHPYGQHQIQLCRACHRTHLHKRFNNPASWAAFKAHVRRGGYARDLKDPTIRKEVDALKKALEAGTPGPFLLPLRDRRLTGTEWWEHLTMDPASLTAFDARPRAEADFSRAWEKVTPTVTDRERAILLAHLAAPGRTISMRDLAHAIGETSYQSMNSAYGKLSHRIAEASEYDPPGRDNGSRMYMFVIAHVGPRNEAGEFCWTMNRSAAAVLSKQINSIPSND